MCLVNPTQYSAYIPFADLLITHNGTPLGHVTARNMLISPGKNEKVEIEGLWDPWGISGNDGVIVARELCSQYASGSYDAVE